MKKKAANPSIKAGPAQTQACSAWDGERRIEGNLTLGVEGALFYGQDTPADRPSQFKKARHWATHHWLVRSILQVRASFYHFGFRIGSTAGKVEGRLARWRDNNVDMWSRYARECWMENLVQDNVLGLWTNNGVPPIIYPLERVEFRDEFGVERIKIQHGLNASQVDKMSLPPKTKAAFKKSSTLELGHDDPLFGFEILKRERMGAGFGPTAIEPIFSACAETESHEVGDAQLAASGRTVYEQHQLGHEIKSGMHAGSPVHFWNKDRAKLVEKQIKGKSGHVRVTTNFDHKILWPRPDPKNFDAKKYESAIQRIAWWGMPLGHMILTRSLNPFLMPMLKTLAADERVRVGTHLRKVFIEALGAPEEVKPVWSNRCFNDPRIAADLLKTGLQAGPLSQGTFVEEAGYDAEEERERKLEESKLSKKVLEPAYDMHHGPISKLKGKPGGTPDES
jgi:hypothetical protein